MDNKPKMMAALLRKPLGSGMAQDAAEKLQTVPGYRDYQIAKMEAGEKPVSLEEYMRGAR